MTSLQKRLLAGVALGMILYAALALAADAGPIMEALGKLPAWTLALCLGMTTVNYGVRFIKWQLFLRTIDVRLPWRRSLHAFLAGMVMSISPGKVGEVLKSALLSSSDGIAAARTAPAVLAERLTDLIGLVILASFGVSAFDYGRPALVITLAGTLGIIGVVNQPRLVGWGLALVGRLPGRGAALQAGLTQAYESARKMLQIGPLTLATLLSVASWGMEGAAFWLILDALGGQDATLQKAEFLFSTTTIFGAISFLPGGLGMTEGTMIGGLMWMGIFAQRGPAIAATYLIRLVTLWYGVGVGFIALLTYPRAAQPAQAEPSSDTPTHAPPNT
jgi:uncharacterized membrane protein YbhN (UPF0104 family)